MITKEELQQKYKKLSTEKLIEIIDNKANYTELAVEVAVAEFDSRDVPESEVMDYRIKQVDNLNSALERSFEPLGFLQKLLFFFLFIPLLHFAFKMNYRSDGATLKLRQSNYYSLIGFISLLLSTFILAIFDWNIAESTVLGIWMIFFIPAYLLDDHFNKRVIIERTNRILVEDYNMRDKEE
ncbi:hypothetical protein AAFN85_24900 [Mucilaginibacter sp. CAU 1740]|uniref:hypothetical protein n=1 Tax=Mucilaginibacter sp. CAU 1740 TaxID=3140365 RepID=UPI00325A89D1